MEKYTILLLINVFNCKWMSKHLIQNYTNFWSQACKEAKTHGH